MKILIVEDEYIVGMDLKARLLSLGQEVVGVFSNYDNAIAGYKASSPDIVFLDINILGDKSGLDVGRSIKAINPKTQLVFISAFSNKNTLAEIEDLNPLGYIRKPFNEINLMEILTKNK